MFELEFCKIEDNIFTSACRQQSVMPHQKRKDMTQKKSLPLVMNKAKQWCRAEKKHDYCSRPNCQYFHNQPVFYRLHSFGPYGGTFDELTELHVQIQDVETWYSSQGTYSDDDPIMSWVEMDGAPPRGTEGSAAASFRRVEAKQACVAPRHRTCTWFISRPHFLALRGG